MSKTTSDVITLSTDSDSLPVVLTREEKEERSQQAAAQAKMASEHRTAEAGYKQQAADSKEAATSATREVERLLGVVRSGKEYRSVPVEVIYDPVADSIVRRRIDTLEVLSERKPDPADREKINMRRQKSLVFNLDDARDQKAKAKQAKPDKSAAEAPAEVTGTIQ